MIRRSWLVRYPLCPVLVNRRMDGGLEGTQMDSAERNWPSTINKGSFWCFNSSIKCSCLSKVCEQAAWRFAKISRNLLIFALSLSLMDFWNFRCLFDLCCISWQTNPDCYFNKSCCLPRLCSTFDIFWQHKGDTSAPGAEMLPGTRGNEVFCEGSLAHS